MYGISPTPRRQRDQRLCRKAVRALRRDQRGTHPLGVEWGTGRDIFAQLLFGLRISLIISTTATLITVTIGVLIASSPATPGESPTTCSAG